MKIKMMNNTKKMMNSMIKMNNQKMMIGLENLKNSNPPTMILK